MLCPPTERDRAINVNILQTVSFKMSQEKWHAVREKDISSLQISRSKKSFITAAEAGVITIRMHDSVHINGPCCGSVGDQLTSFEM